MDAWIFIGMMGAGKTTLGKLVAEKTGRKFIDTDRLIEQRLGRPISQFFQLYGEEAFRDHETAIIVSLQPEPSVVATGGGAILREKNYDHLRTIGKVVYLRSNPRELIRRLEASKKKRPLLNAEDWETRLVGILEQRKALYEAADVIIDVDSLDQEGIVQKVIELLS